MLIENINPKVRLSLQTPLQDPVTLLLPPGSKHGVRVSLSLTCSPFSPYRWTPELCHMPCYITDCRSHVPTLNNSCLRTLSISVRTFISFILIFHHFVLNVWPPLNCTFMSCVQLPMSSISICLHWSYNIAPQLVSSLVLSPHWIILWWLVLTSLLHLSLFGFSWDSFRHWHLLCSLWVYLFIILWTLHLR